MRRPGDDLLGEPLPGDRPLFAVGLVPRYLNCGYRVAIVGGTDKMAASTAVGTVRTYAHLDKEEEFTYEGWKEAVRRAETFASYGPLLEFAVDGRPMGSRLSLPTGGGRLEVTWQAASRHRPHDQGRIDREWGDPREPGGDRQRRAAGAGRSRWTGAAGWPLLVRGRGIPGSPRSLRPTPRR